MAKQQEDEVMRTYDLRCTIGTLVLAVLGTTSPWLQAGVFVQCPGDTNGDAVIDAPDPEHPNAVCRHLTGGDGFIEMADGRGQYMFGFSDVTGVLPRPGHGNGRHWRPTSRRRPSVSKEGDEFYLTLTNVGMVDAARPVRSALRALPRLPATPAPIFDGVPECAIAINMGASLTYYYKIVEPGTFMYHCHVEATEHMQMGMLGNLYVHPQQNGTPNASAGRTYDKFVYNDGDGSTGYDVEYADPDRVVRSGTSTTPATRVQPLPFAQHAGHLRRCSTAAAIRTP